MWVCIGRVPFLVKWGNTSYSIAGWLVSYGLNSSESMDD